MTKWNEITKLSLMNFFTNLFFLSSVSVFFYQQRGLDYFQILALESVLVLFIFFFELPTGIFADKYGRKSAIVLGTILFATEPLIFLFADSFLIFAIAFALSGIGLAFLSGTVEALIYDHLKARRKEKLMKKAMGTFGSASLIAMVIAPAIGSFMAKDLFPNQFTFLLYLTFGAMFIGIIISLLIKDTKLKGAKRETSVTLLKDGLNLLKKNKSFLHIVLLSIFSTSFVFTLNYLFQPYLKDSGVNVALFGSIFAIALLLSAVFQKYAYKLEKKLGMKQSVFLATLLPGLLYILMAFVFHPIVSVLLFIFIVGIIGLKNPLFSDYKNIHIPSKNRATVLSLISMFVAIYLVIMRLIIGKLADINLSYAFLLMGTIIIIFSIALRIDERHITKAF